MVKDFLAVVGGLITPTLLISGSGSNALNLDNQTRTYMIASSFIVSSQLEAAKVKRICI